MAREEKIYLNCHQEPCSHKKNKSREREKMDKGGSFAMLVENPNPRQLEQAKRF